MATYPRLDVFSNGHLIGFGGPQVSGPTYWGLVAADGTPIIVPEGVTITKLAIGQYRIVHNLNAIFYVAFASSRSGIKVGVFPTNYQTNSVDINAVSVPSGTDIDIPFSFILAVLR